MQVEQEMISKGDYRQYGQQSHDCLSNKEPRDSRRHLKNRQCNKLNASPTAAFKPGDPQKDKRINTCLDTVRYATMPHIMVSNSFFNNFILAEITHWFGQILINWGFWFTYRKPRKSHRRKLPHVLK